MKKINDSHLGLAILVSVFAFFAVAYLRVRSERLAADRNDGPPVSSRTVLGKPALLLRARHGGPVRFVPPVGLKWNVHAGNVELLNRAQADLTDAQLSIDSRKLAGDPQLKAARNEIVSALERLQRARNLMAPTVRAQPVSYVTTG